jgi:epoxyqueuosine reductase
VRGPGAVHDLTAALRRAAHEMGFSLVGVTPARASEHTAFYRGWIDAGRHGEMAYLARPDAVARRADLSLTMPEAVTCVVVAHEYMQEDPPGVPEDPSRAVIARYARGADYHDVLKGKLVDLLAWLDRRVEGGVRGRPYVDTGPILERELARRAGLGWFGRNTMLIHPGRGSYFFLGVLLVDAPLAETQPFEEDRCGTCRACLDACPTGALLGRDTAGAPVIDARRCISYLTIELRGPIPRELRSAVGNRVFGCDICQEVCPWNEQFARPAVEPAYRQRAETSAPSLVELATRLLDTDEEGFRRMFGRSAIRRAKRAGLLRNVCVALGNWGGAGAVAPLVRALGDAAPLVRGHAAWALGRIGSHEARAALAAARTSEPDLDVREELVAALSPER